MHVALITLLVVGLSWQLASPAAACSCANVYATQSVVTVRESVSCGLSLELGIRYLIFGAKESWIADSPEGELGASLCGGGRSYGFDPDTAVFGVGRPPVAGASCNCNVLGTVTPSE